MGSNQKFIWGFSVDLEHSNSSLYENSHNVVLYVLSKPSLTWKHYFYNTTFILSGKIVEMRPIRDGWERLYAALIC